MFSEFANVKPSEKGTYLMVPGLYRLEVVRCKWREDPRAGSAFIASLLVLESPDEVTHPLGSTVDYYQGVSRAPYPESARSDIVAFLAATGLPIDGAAAASSLELAVGAQNPLAGRKVRVQATSHATKKDPAKTYLRLRWYSDDAAPAAVPVAVPAPVAAPVAVPPGYHRFADGKIRPIPEGFRVALDGSLIPV
jgi:hypothetical protein